MQYTLQSGKKSELCENSTKPVVHTMRSDCQFGKSVPRTTFDICDYWRYTEPSYAVFTVHSETDAPLIWYTPVNFIKNDECTVNMCLRCIYDSPHFLSSPWNMSGVASEVAVLILMLKFKV